MSLVTILVASFASFIAGIVDAIAGGGGVVIMPTLIFLGFPIDMVLGTNKLVGTAGTSFATANFVKKKHYSDFVVRYNLIFTCVGAALGAFFASYVDETILKPLVSVLIIGMALYLFFKPEIGTQTQELNHIKKRIKVSLLGAFGIGFYDGIFGPGTGAFLTFMFIKLLGQNFLLANGNTKILNLASNAVALIIFIVNQKIIWMIGVPMAIANMAGGYLGAQIAIRRGAKWVRWIFIVMATLVGLKQLM